MSTKTVIAASICKTPPGISILVDQDQLFMQHRQQIEEQQAHEFCLNDVLVSDTEPQIRIYQQNIDMPSTIRPTITDKDAEEDIYMKMSLKSQASVAMNHNNNSNNNYTSYTFTDNKVNEDDDANRSQETCNETGCTVTNFSTNTHTTTTKTTTTTSTKTNTVTVAEESMQIQNAKTTVTEYPYLLLRVGDHAAKITSATNESSERPKATTTYTDYDNEAHHYDEHNEQHNIVESMNRYNNNNNNNNKINHSHPYIEEKCMKSSLICNGQTTCVSVRDLTGQSQQQLEHQRLETNCHDDQAFSLTSKADCVSSAVTEWKSKASQNSSKDLHVVKIQIQSSQEPTILEHRVQTKAIDKQVTIVKLNENTILDTNNILSANNIQTFANASENLNLGIDSMVQKTQMNGVGAGNGNVVTTGGTTVTELNVSNPNYLYYMMSSGQFSPCDTLDSGTGSDLESNGHMPNGDNTSPKQNMGKTANVPKLELHLKTTKVRVNNAAAKALEHQRASSLTDSEESEASSLSCDSLHSVEFSRTPIISPNTKDTSVAHKFGTVFPDSLLRDIRGRKSVSAEHETYDNLRHSRETVNEQNYVEVQPAKIVQDFHAQNSLSAKSAKRAAKPNKTFIINQEQGLFVDTKMNSMPRTYEADKYYDFHVKEHENFHSLNISTDDINSAQYDSLTDSCYENKSLSDESFAGYKDILCGSTTSTIRSSKGTVRGVKNRVRNGIATFLQFQHPIVKSFKEKDMGKVVLYTTSMGIIRETYAKCSNVKQILRTLLVKFEERDVFMSIEYQQEIKERMQSDIIKVPQLFVEGQHIGDAETVERLNESGELRQLLKPYKSIATTYTCQTCGGYRLLPCPSCNGSKKSVHRNHFTAEFVALKCMNCDEVGLVKCHNC